jgi:hypothetical protein
MCPDNNGVGLAWVLLRRKNWLKSGIFLLRFFFANYGIEKLIDTFLQQQKREE